MKRIVTYDSEVDAAYVYVGCNPGEPRGARSGGDTIRVSDDFILDLDAGGALAGVEILHASRYGVDKLRNTVTPGEV